METTIYDLQGKETGKLNLPGVFETKVSPALLHEVVTGYLANRRAGTHSTKTRGEVSGGGKKPWREKGTGNARAGSNRSPLWRKGGIIFGPRPHRYIHNLSEQKRRLSLGMALAVKAKEGNLLVVESFEVSEPKTKKVAEILKNLKLDAGTVLLAIEKAGENLKKASRNIESLAVVDAANINAYQVLWAKKVVVTRQAVEQLQKRVAA